MPQTIKKESTVAAPQNPALHKSFTTKEGSPQSVYSRWRQADPIFMNKYSSGMTPPNKRESISTQNNQMLIQDDNVPKKSKSYYFKQPASNTLTSD